MTNLNKDIVIISDYFQKNDPESGRSSKGVFMGLSLKVLKQNLDYLLDSNFLSSSTPFVDAGSGDGRIPIFTGINYGWDSLGVEYDSKFHNLAKRNYEKLWDAYSFPRKNIKLIRGDFTKDLSYGQAGLRFSDVGTFLNFNSNSHSLVEKIKTDSPSGTKFLFYGFNDNYSFDNMNKLLTLKNTYLRNGSKNIISVKQDVIFGSNRAKFNVDVIYAHLFEKE